MGQSKGYNASFSELGTSANTKVAGRDREIGIDEINDGRNQSRSRKEECAQNKAGPQKERSKADDKGKVTARKVKAKGKDEEQDQNKDSSKMEIDMTESEVEANQILKAPRGGTERRHRKLRNGFKMKPEAR